MKKFQEKHIKYDVLTYFIAMECFLKKVIKNNKTMMNVYRNFLEPMFETEPFGRYKNDFKVIKNEDEYKIYVSVPGLTKDDLTIKIENDILSISYEGEETEKGFYFIRNFKKSYYIPDEVDAGSIEAKVLNGILEVVLPKSKKKKKQERLIAIS